MPRVLCRNRALTLLESSWRISVGRTAFFSTVFGGMLLWAEPVPPAELHRLGGFFFVQPAPELPEFASKLLASLGQEDRGRLLVRPKVDGRPPLLLLSVREGLLARCQNLKLGTKMLPPGDFLPGTVREEQGLGCGLFLGAAGSLFFGVLLVPAIHALRTGDHEMFRGAGNWLTFGLTGDLPYANEIVTTVPPVLWFSSIGYLAYKKISGYLKKKRDLSHEDIDPETDRWIIQLADRDLKAIDAGGVIIYAVPDHLATEEAFLSIERNLTPQGFQLAEGLDLCAHRLLFGS